MYNASMKHESDIPAVSKFSSRYFLCILEEGSTKTVDISAKRNLVVISPYAPKDGNTGKLKDELHDVLIALVRRIKVSDVVAVVIEARIAV